VNRPDRLQEIATYHLLSIRVHLPNDGTFGCERTLRAGDVFLQRGAEFPDDSFDLRVPCGAADLRTEAADSIVSIGRHHAALRNGDPLAGGWPLTGSLTDGNKEKV
jgi:hypothetical protein